MYIYVEGIRRYTKIYKIPGGGGTAPADPAPRRRPRSGPWRPGPKWSCWKSAFGVASKLQTLTELAVFEC